VEGSFSLGPPCSISIVGREGKADKAENKANIVTPGNPFFGYGGFVG